MVPEIRFVLVSMARSGTTLTVDLLNQHPDVYAHLEIFAQDRPEIRLRPEARERLEGQDVHADPVTFLQNVMRYTPHHKCVGFKMWPTQSTQAYDAALADPSVHKIIHQRTNMLASLSSNALAKATGLSHVGSEKQKIMAQSATRPLLRFDAESLKSMVRKRRRMFLKALEHSVGPTLITTHLGVVGKGVSQVYDFLGLPPFEPERRYQKVNSGPILNRYHRDDHALIKETLQEIGAPEWIAEDQESHIVTLADRDRIKAARKAARRAKIDLGNDVWLRALTER